MTDNFEKAKLFLESLRRTQTLSARDFARYRAPLIERLCRHAALQTDFYSDRLQVLFENRDAESGKFRFERWCDVPILDRTEAQLNNIALHARETPGWVGPSQIKLTSGSTGRPLFTHRSEAAEIAGLALFERLLEWHEFDRSASFGWVRAPGDRAELTHSEGRGWNLVDPQAKRFELSKVASIGQILGWLRSVAPHYLHAPPSIVDGLIEEVNTGLESVHLRKILITSETPREGLALRVREQFGATLVDTYGTREIGQIAVTCPFNSKVMHVSSECALIEIVKEDGRRATAGETGTVIATPFYNYGTPLIRYDLGDYAIVGEPCPCGRTLPTVSQVIGRKTALFRSRDGGKRAPTGLEMIRGLVPLLQLQIVQTAFERIEVKYVPNRSGPPPDFNAATEFLKGRLHPDLEVKYSPAENILRGPGGKFEDFICAIES